MQITPSWLHPGFSRDAKGPKGRLIFGFLQYSGVKWQRSLEICLILEKIFLLQV